MGSGKQLSNYQVLKEIKKFWKKRESLNSK